MGRRRSNRPVQDDASALTHRMNWLLTHHWGNRIASMAKDLGVSPTAISRVLAGQMPSGVMLEALARRADINMRWLLGGGSLDEPRHGPGVLCPVAKSLLPGALDAHPEKLTPVTLPVASPFWLAGAYWYRVRLDDPIARDKTSRVDGGDYLLVETSPHWTQRIDAFRGRIVVLWLRQQGKAILAKVAAEPDYFESESEYEIVTFGMFEEARLLPQVTSGSARPKRPRGETGEKDTRRFFQDDIVGVCLMLSRMLDRSNE